MQAQSSIQYQFINTIHARLQPSESTQTYSTAIFPRKFRPKRPAIIPSKSIALSARLV